jgi:integrase
MAINIPGERTKNGLAHSVPITPAIRRVLDALPESGDFIITGNGAGLGGHSQAKRKLDEKVTDVEPWVFHDLRRTLATGCAKLGIPVHIVERMLNHVSGTRGNPLVRIYQRHDYADEVVAAFHKWSAHVEALVKAKKAAA